MYALRQNAAAEGRVRSEGELHTVARRYMDEDGQTEKLKDCLLSRNGEDARNTLVLEGGHQHTGAFFHAAEILLAPDSAFSARCGSVQFGGMK
jgi:hypothetical protein